MPNQEKKLDIIVDPRKGTPPGDGMPLDEVPFDTIPGNPDPSQIVVPTASAPETAAAEVDLSVDLSEPEPVIPSAPAPVAKKPAFFIILIRSRKGTYHPVLDKNKGPGALATFTEKAEADHQVGQLRKVPQYAGLSIGAIPIP